MIVNHPRRGTFDDVTTLPQKIQQWTDHFLSFFGRDGLPYTSGHSGEGKTRQTEEQPMTVTTEKQAQHDISTTRSALHASG